MADAARVIKPVIESLFRLLFTYDCVGEEHVPERGGAVVAANHPSYLDPVLLSLQVRRPIRFMAAEFLFKVPLLGLVMRAFGAFPVDVRPGHGREAYQRAKALVDAGEVVGIFPEGKRSRAGWMESSLREGAARLAWETGVRLVPATITGAFRAWPHFQSLPRPARVRVRFHPPVDPAPWRELPEEEALSALLTALRERVERSLLPGVKADLRKEVLYRTPAPPPRVHEVLLAAAPLAAGVVSGGWWLATAGVLDLAYLLLDWRGLRQTRVAKWVRTASPLLFGMAVLPAMAAVVRAPPFAAPAALWAIVLGAGFPYLYARTRTALAFVRGFVVATVMELVALALWPSTLGPHLALPLFAAAFAVSRRTVFWRWAAGALVGYVLVIAGLLGLETADTAHVIAAAVAWITTRLFRRDPLVRIRPASTIVLAE